MRSEQKQEARSVNPVQAQIKSLSGAILTIIDATYADTAQREAVKSLIKAEIRRKMDYVTDEWILRTLQIGVNITKIPKTDVPLTSAWKTHPEEYTEEELKRLQDLEEEVVEVDGVEFAKEAFKEKVVVDGVEFEKEKKIPDSTFIPAFSGMRSHTVRANDTAEAEQEPFAEALCRQCQNPKLKGVHTCAAEIAKRKKLDRHNKQKETVKSTSYDIFKTQNGEL